MNTNDLSVTHDNKHAHVSNPHQSDQSRVMVELRSVLISSLGVQ
jgi:hypothetical protein